MQGISIFIRKAIGVAGISLDINQYEAPPKPPNTATDVFWHIDIAQSASGVTSTQENRCLDNTEREHTDWLFGAVKGSSRLVSLDEFDDAFLKTGWEGADEAKAFIVSHVESQGNGWVATQIWGFKVTDGVRRYARNILVTKGDKRVEMRLYYDYVE